MRLKLLSVLLLIQSCISTKNDIIPEKSCKLESFYNQEGKINGKYFYDNNSLVKFNSDWKDFNFSVTSDLQKLTSKFELYAIGAVDCAFNSKMQLISANSSFGKFTVSYEDDNLKEIIFEATGKSSIINTTDSKWIYTFDTENGNIKKAYLTLGSTISKRLIFEGISFDNNPNILPIEARNAQLFRTLINFIKGGEILDFDYLCKNNILSKKYYRVGEPLVSQNFSYQYNNEGYITEMKYSNTGKVSYNYICE